MSDNVQVTAKKAPMDPPFAAPADLLSAAPVDLPPAASADLLSAASVDLPSTADLLTSYAPSAGLTSTLAARGQTLTLAQRLAANPFLMAPMAGISNAAWRIMTRAGGAGLAYTEMISVCGLHYQGEKTWRLALPDALEPDVAVQLFGKDPALFREAILLLHERLGSKLALIDINMACPVPKVVRKGEGSALLGNPEQAAAIVRACRETARVPVTVKIRTGLRDDVFVAPAFARMLEAAGADAVAVHGRSAAQLYRGTSCRARITEVVRAVDIPVIASGDVMSAKDACETLQQTGAAAVFVARGSYGNPWIFTEARKRLAGDNTLLPRSIEQRVSACMLHVRLLQATGIRLEHARSLAGWYFKGLPHAAHLRKQWMHCATLDDYLGLASDVLTYWHEYKQSHTTSADTNR